MTKRLLPMLDDPRESAQVRELLEVGRNAQVSDYDFEQGLRRHLSQIEAGAAMPHWAEALRAGSTTAAGNTLSGSLWLWIGLPLISVTAITAIVLIRSGEAPAAPAAAPVPPMAAPSQAEPQPAPEAAATAPVGTPARHQVEGEGAQPNRSPRRVRPAVTAPSRSGATESVHVARRADKVGSELPFKAESAAKAPRVAAPTAIAAPGAVPAPATKAAAPARKPPAVVEPEPEEQQAAAQAPERPEPEPKPVVDEARLEREMGMLAMTQRVLFTDPARALNLARQGEAEFEGSMFTQERQQLLLLALVKLGRLDEAKRLARPYLARYPQGPFSDRVRRALATGRVDR